MSSHMPTLVEALAVAHCLDEVAATGAKLSPIEKAARHEARLILAAAAKQYIRDFVIATTME